MDNMETATIRPGALSFLLQITRLAGGTPLSFKVLSNGYKISVSRCQQAYCIFILTVLNILGFLDIYLKYRYLKKSLNDPQSLSTKMIVLSQRVFYVLVSTVGYMGSYRMKNMIHVLNILEKIKSKIPYGYTAVTVKHDTNLMWLYSLIISMNIVIIISDNILNALRASVYDISIIVYAIHYFHYLILLLLKIQIVVLNFEVYKVLLELNEKLRYLLAMAVSENISINAKTGMVKNKIRSLIQSYIAICKVVRELNKADGLYMLLIYLTFTVSGVFTGYRLIVTLNTPTDVSYRWFDIIIRCSWCIMIVVRTIFFLEPFHRISFQIAEMTRLLTKLTLQMTPLGTPVSIELDIMIKQVILNEPKYYLPGIQTLDRSLLITTFTAITTYLVFVIQTESNK